MTDTDSARDVVDILSADHTEFLALVDAIAASGDAEQRRDLTDTLIAELVRHAVAEEMYVYPAMKDHLPDGAEKVEHDTKEHKELEVTMKKMEGADAGSTEFIDLLRELDTILRDHVNDEEAEQFPELRTHIPREQMIELGAKVESAKKLAP